MPGFSSVYCKIKHLGNNFLCLMYFCTILNDDDDDEDGDGSMFTFSCYRLYNANITPSYVFLLDSTDSSNGGVAVDDENFWMAYI